MNDQIIQLIGLVAAYLAAVIKLIIAVVNKYHQRSGRTTSIWLVLYMIFVLNATGLRYFGLLDVSKGRLLFTISSVVVLIAMVFHLFIKEKIDEGNVEVKEIKKIKLEGEVVAKE